MLSVRCRRFSTAALTMVVFSIIAGCAIPVPERPISYIPQENVQPVKDADAIPVEVRVEDLEGAPSALPWSPRYLLTRPDLSFRVKDPADTVKGAAETELRARGFTIGSGGALVTIQLVHFEATYEPDPFGMVTTARANLSMRVQVSPPTGKVLYSRDVGGEGTPISGVFMLHHPATHELQGSLSDAFRRLFDDSAFTAAILATRQAPPAKPVNPGRIAGAFATMSRR
jgi:hypothetical protein